MTTNPIRNPRFVNLQAANATPFWRAVATWLGEATRRPITMETEGPWRDQRDALRAGELDLGTICGAWYVDWVAADPGSVALLAAPVMEGALYGGQPVYFSHVVVRADGPIEVLEDLAEGRWAFNEPDSYSGKLVLHHEMARRGWGPSYFGSLVESGSHETSLALVAAGAVDAAAIDSVVWEMALRAQPERAHAFRIIDTWGPAPMPPVVASRAVSPAWRARYRDTLLAMHRDPAGRQILASAGVARFAAVEDADYDPLRALQAAP